MAVIPDDDIVGAVSTKAEGGETGVATQPEAPAGEQNIIAESLSNIPASGGRMLGDLASAVMHPIDTVTALGKTALGVGEMLAPGEPETPEEQERAQMAQGLIDFYKGRYGSMEGLEQTIRKDPVGFLADLSTVAIPAGKAVQAGGKLAGLADVAKAGETAAKVGAMVEPIGGAVGAAKTAVKAAIPGEWAERMYESAAKFRTTLSDAERAAITRTALEHKVMPHRRGLAALRGKIDALNDRVTQLVDNATATGQKIQLTDLLNKEMRALYDDARLSGEGQDAVNSITSVRKKIKEANDAIGRGEFTPKEAQKFKQNLYKEVESYYEKVNDAPIKAETKMVIARNARLAIEKLIPEIGQLNASEGALIDLWHELERSSGRIRNRDFLGIGLPIKASAGGALAGGGGGAAATALGLLDTPLVKAKLAIVLDQLKRKGVKFSPSHAAIRLGLMEPSRVKREQPSAANILTPQIEGN